MTKQESKFKDRIELSLAYNTNKKKLVLPEYGRNIQKMVEKAKSLPTREERTNAVVTIVKIMADMNPQMKDQNEFIHKLWDYVYMMADYDLDVDSPYPPPEREVIEKKPERLPYFNNKIAYRYFGVNVERMIKRGVQLEEGKKKQLFVNAIASYMKMAYRIWNDEKVSDEIILGHLEELSNGKLKLDKLVELNKNYDTHLGNLHKKGFVPKQGKFQNNKNFKNSKKRFGKKRK